MSSFRDLLRWYNNKDVVPTLEAMQKTIAFYHDKNIDTLKLGCTLPNWLPFAYRNLPMQKSIPSQSEIKTFWKKIREDVVCWPSLVFTSKAVVDEKFIRKSTNICNSSVGIDASQLYPYSICQPLCPPVFLRVGISTQKRVDSHLDKTRPAVLKIWSCPITNEQDQNVKLKRSLQQADRRKLTASALMGFCSYCNTVFEAMGCFYHSFPC